MSLKARYAGMCPVCKKRWAVGDEIANDDENQWVHARCSDLPAWTPPPSTDFERKAASEEARYVTCPECGYAGGRHARMCRRG